MTRTATTTDALPTRYSIFIPDYENYATVTTEEKAPPFDAFLQEENKSLKKENELLKEQINELRDILSSWGYEKLLQGE